MQKAKTEGKSGENIRFCVKSDAGFALKTSVQTMESQQNPGFFPLFEACFMPFSLFLYKNAEFSQKTTNCDANVG